MHLKSWVNASLIDMSELISRNIYTFHFLRWFIICKRSAKDLFNAVSTAVKNNPGLKKVVILKQTPRLRIKKWLQHTRVNFRHIFSFLLKNTNFLFVSITLPPMFVFARWSNTHLWGWKLSIRDNNFSDN